MADTAAIEPDDEPEIDEDWDEEEAVCPRCKGDGMDPFCDYLLPCPCQGGQ